MAVLDFGAGRGKAAEREAGYKLTLGTLRGRCAKVIGADIDPAVRENSLIDEAVVLEPSRPLPFADQTFDLILAWAVFEHLDDPAFYAGELARVLKVGGWICAWTPNKFGPVAVGARLVPERLQAGFVAFLLPERKEQDTFPTIYRLNTLSALRRYFPPERFHHCSYAFTGEPRYHGNRRALAAAWEIYRRLAPRRFASHLHVFLQKQG
jgi:SAM-dependent methyltransferase